MADARATRLIAIARESIEQRAPCAVAADEPWLVQPGASFVTLRIGQALRGCIGSLEARRALGEDIAHNAYAAAYRDPRFPPVGAEELVVLRVEVSVLSAPEPLPVASEAEALERMRAGVDGVVLEYQGVRATFLPQVWEDLPSPVDFLGALRRKAGLPARFWHRDMRLSRYTVEKYA